MDDAYNNIDDYNPSRKRKVLIVFDYLIADIMTNKKLQAIMNYLSNAENWIFSLYLSLSLIFLFQK